MKMSWSFRIDEVCVPTEVIFELANAICYSKIFQGRNKFCYSKSFQFLALQGFSPPNKLHRCLHGLQFPRHAHGILAKRKLGFVVDIRHRIFTCTQEFLTFKSSTTLTQCYTWSWFWLFSRV